MTSQEKIAVIQAQDRGEAVQARVRRGGYNEKQYASEHGYEWADDINGTNGPHAFDFVSFDYRIKPRSVRLNDEYEAVIEGDGVVVGCQSFPAAKVLELARMIESTFENVYVTRRV